jgi:hypothetical protein
LAGKYSQNEGFSASFLQLFGFVSVFLWDVFFDDFHVKIGKDTLELVEVGHQEDHNVEG